MSQPQPWAQAAGRDSFLRYLRLQQITDRDLARILGDAATEAERMVGRLVGREGIGAQVRRAQYAQSALALRRLQEQLWDEINRSIRQGIERASLLGVEAGGVLTELLRTARVPLSVLRSLEVAARMAGEQVRSRLINNIDLSPRVWRNRELMNGRLDRVINNGIGLGKSAKEIAADVRRFISPNTPGGASYAARRLGRTELNNAFHTTTVRTAADQPWVTGMKWNLSSSHPRPDPCDDLANDNHDDLGRGVFAPHNVPSKPHPQCLCYVTVVTLGRDDFVRSLVNGRYDSWMASKGVSISAA